MWRNTEPEQTYTEDWTWIIPAWNILPFNCLELCCIDYWPEQESCLAAQSQRWLVAAKNSHQSQGQFLHCWTQSPCSPTQQGRRTLSWNLQNTLNKVRVENMEVSSTGWSYIIRNILQKTHPSTRALRPLGYRRGRRHVRTDDNAPRAHNDPRGTPGEWKWSPSWKKHESFSTKQRLKLKMNTRAEAAWWMLLPEGISTTRHQTEAQGRPSAFSFSSLHSLAVAEKLTSPKTAVHLVMHTGPGLMPACQTGSEYSADYERLTAKKKKKKPVTKSLWILSCKRILQKC